MCNVHTDGCRSSSKHRAKNDGEKSCAPVDHQNRTENTTHQVEVKKQKMVENELMTQNLRNKLGQSNDEFKCPVQSAVALCETFCMLRSANLRVGVLPTEMHVSETDGSGTNPRETNLGKGKGGRHAKTRERVRKP